MKKCPNPIGALFFIVLKLFDADGQVVVPIVVDDNPSRHQNCGQGNLVGPLIKRKVNCLQLSIHRAIPSCGR